MARDLPKTSLKTFAVAFTSNSNPRSLKSIEPDLILKKNYFNFLKV